MRPLHAAVLLSLVVPATADEGMWLFNKPPLRQVQEKYGFGITPEWLEHLQKSSVRFGNGGSGSFVSGQGLILTNHHVGAGMIEKLSTPDRDLLKDGFLAPGMADELACPDLELNVLMSIEDVTERVNAAISPDQSAAEAAAARRAVIAAIEKESLEATGLRSDVVTLYQGGEYHLYRYQRYTDVRLVFAPDSMAAAFGGDVDNFEYPRYCLDCCFFRAYVDGKPAVTPDFLKWNSKGAREGELVFTSGHPGRTNRSNTLAQLEDLRDDSFPHRLEQIFRNETVLQAWAERDVENARRAERSIIGTQNGRKAIVARLDGLLDAGFMARKAEAEQKLRGQADGAFGEIEAAGAEMNGSATRLRMLEGGDGFGSGLFWIARELLRAGDEAGKPDGERLSEYQDAGRVSLELDLFSDEPVYKDMETLKLASSLTFLCAKLGATDPLVAKILDGKSPQVRAAELVKGTGLEEVALRRKLYEGGKDAVAASDDPMIALARLVDAESRELRTLAETNGERVAQAHAKIAKARFAAEGDATYPDATFTLRLSSGVVKGYTEEGEPVPAQTDFGGMLARHEKQGGVKPFDLSPEWKKRGGDLNPEVAFNFVSTNDITGGNSGSPVVNQAGELVGLIFDTNSHGLVSDFAYTEDRGRAVSVSSAGILEAMRVIYRADRVLEELGQ
ncbi:S46 family peptidase [Luteolibacter marinus]|uniref:S46 family peptidase n=1 Tax=Luteolibacter marinus TaxID=2776705 RepID=UPI00186611C5|nr:S46 family peptidase [Luteolibacter marinus]